MLLVSCSAPAVSHGPDAGVVASWRSGAISGPELEAEARRLPPSLKERFETSAGREELARAMVTKRLLVEEARRRGLNTRDDIRRQVDDLEQKLIVQALLDDEKGTRGHVTDAELKTWFDAHHSELDRPAVFRAARLYFAGTTKDAKVSKRVNEARERLLKGEPVDKVALAGEGPERVLGGDIGFVVDSTPGAAAIRALKAVHDVSPVISLDGGVAVFVLTAHEDAHQATFDESKAAIEGRLAPGRDKAAFDALVERLTKEADVKVMQHQ